MTALREAAQQALEALEMARMNGEAGLHKYETLQIAESAEALRAALAERVQEPDVPETNFGNMEPVGWFQGPFGEFRANQLFKHSWPAQTVAWSIPLYTTPPQRNPLTDGDRLSPTESPTEPVQEPVQVCWLSKLQPDAYLPNGELNPKYLKPALAEPDFPLGHASTDVPMTVYVLKKAESEPVAWIHTDPDKPRVKFLEWREDEPGYRGRWIKTPLYTSPPQRNPEPVQEPYTDDVTRIMRDAGMTFHLGLPHKAVVEQMTRVVDLVYAEASIKAAQQFANPPQRKPPATIDEMFDRMDKAPKGVFFGHDPMTIWMEAWRAAERAHGITS